LRLVRNALLALAWLIVATFVIDAHAATAACQLPANGGRITHVVHIQFDHLLLRRASPNIPADLELMPHLYSFLTENGVIAGNHHTSLLANPATDILTILTGVYGDRMGMPIADSYGYYRADGSVGFASAYAYWRAIAPDGYPQMLTETGRMAPAPWVPFTRAGCDVGTFGMANMALESAPSDIAAVFGSKSLEVRAAARDPIKAKADFLGIAVHCGSESRLCADPRYAREDVLPDEPGGYLNFGALFGNTDIQPMISPQGPVPDLYGHTIQDAYGNPGFPNLFTPNAAQSLGYAAAMLEAGIPIVYTYIGDVHELKSANESRSLGPGEPALMMRLADYDKAFAAFIDRLQKAGINKNNTLFIIASDEGAHFGGGPSTPSNCDGVNRPCNYPEFGETDVYVDRLLRSQFRDVTAFGLHFDSAPCFYIRDNPAPNDPVTRTLEQDVNRLAVLNPASGQTDSLVHFIADQATLKLLHMVTASPARTPSFAVFGSADYFQMAAQNPIQVAGKSGTDCNAASPCTEKDPGYGWTYGGNDPDISHSWFGMVGPGVRKLGIDNDVFTDHADIRPTVLDLLGLVDDYAHDGRVVAEFLEASALPVPIRSNIQTFIALSQALKQIDAPLGSVATNGLAQSTQMIGYTDSAYAYLSKAMDALVVARNLLAKQIKSQLEAAAFANVPLDESRAASLIGSAHALIAEVAANTKDNALHLTPAH
jgi:hypothetical protein